MSCEIYTDGACSSNRRNSSRSSAGVGVHIVGHQELDYSAPLRAAPHTNQRAELEAILIALELLQTRPELQPYHTVTIWSDSSYSINCVTNWCKAWQRNGWINSQGKPVENQDLIKPIIAALLAQPRVSLKKVAGHAGVAGNERADQLARAGVSPNCKDQARAKQAALVI